ncbi:HhH-GPD-type base excision DNA repair protein [Zhihengliuella salsuginis]|uniref:(Fe-S)-cluster assembly protein n=1 Tax=Zhihengliuella salsuginis TaxID=578222 RepID=A0ABQ3GCF7_9MICC|nr:HhH-GPD-type base excision DNA repair protein [Zhihengliuella salsuginis]GHD01518.1 (Fe-S)-cluster assembly protein [Zhihengliuella salsuginis]
MSLHITGDPEADGLLDRDPLALLIGMLLDQQVTMESAFAGPAKIAERAGTLDPGVLADMKSDEFVELFRITPAVHRFPGSMAGRVQAVCAAIRDEWDSRAENIWTAGDPDGREILKRLKALPGFGEQKARIFLALLGKQRGLEAAGWREAAGAYGEDGADMSVADIVDEPSLQRVRQNKKAMKAAAKAAKQK